MGGVLRMRDVWGGRWDALSEGTWEDLNTALESASKAPDEEVLSPEAWVLASMKDKRIAIHTGKGRMTVVDKTLGGLVRCTYYSWWWDGKQWCSRTTYVLNETDDQGKHLVHEGMDTYFSLEALARSLSFDAGCKVNP